MAYANNGGFDTVSELEILNGFVCGPVVIAKQVTTKYRELEKFGDDNALPSALEAQSSLVRDRLSFILDEFRALPTESRQELDRRLVQANSAPANPAMKMRRTNGEGQSSGKEPTH